MDTVAGRPSDAGCISCGVAGLPRNGTRLSRRPSARHVPHACRVRRRCGGRTRRPSRRRIFGDFMRSRGWTDYAALHDYSTQQPGRILVQDVAEHCRSYFNRPPAIGLAAGGDPRRAEWFPDSQLNIAESCLQVADEAPAVVVGQRRRNDAHYPGPNCLPPCVAWRRGCDASVSGRGTGWRWSCP